MIVLINYASSLFQEKQKINSETGLRIGNIEKVYSFSEKDIDPIFFEKNKDILLQDKGAGYWLWKPYFILYVLESLNDGDYLFYCDSGAYFIDAIDSLVELSKNLKQDIIAFHTDHLEKHYTKRDTFVLMNCDSESFANTRQCAATMHLWKKTPFSIQFLHEWLEYAQDIRILSGMENVMGEKNHVGFIDHRYDQSIFSLLCKKYDLQTFPEPTQYGNDERKQLNHPYLKQFLHHTKGDKIKRTFLQKILHEISRPFKGKK